MIFDGMSASGKNYLHSPIKSRTIIYSFQVRQTRKAFRRGAMTYPIRQSISNQLQGDIEILKDIPLPVPQGTDFNISPMPSISLHALTHF
jgi:hypothetical protein